MSACHRPVDLAHLDRPVTGRRATWSSTGWCAVSASGGLRMRAGCTLDEVAGLARGMTMKEALHYDPDGRYIPLGGAKGGIDCDPQRPRGVRRAVALPAGDAPVHRAVLDDRRGPRADPGPRRRAAAEAGLVSSIQAVYPLLDDERRPGERLADAFAVEVDGIGLDELVGGCGVAEAVLAALDRAGVAVRRARGWPSRGSARWAEPPRGSSRAPG